MRILVTEDEPRLADYLKKGLTEAGYVVDVANNGVDGSHLATEGDYDLIVLDVMLPGIDGFGVLRKLRETRNTPVLMLTARDKVEDRVQGLKGGADDYLVKPFAFSELLARVEALLRRGGAVTTQPLTSMRLGDLELDLARRKATRGGPALGSHAQGIQPAHADAAAAGRGAVQDGPRRAGLGHEFRQRNECRGRGCAASAIKAG